MFSSFSWNHDIPLPLTGIFDKSPYVTSPHTDLFKSVKISLILHIRLLSSVKITNIVFIILFSFMSQQHYGVCLLFFSCDEVAFLYFSTFCGIL